MRSFDVAEKYDLGEARGSWNGGKIFYKMLANEIKHNAALGK